jgi:hypothetical protein
MIRPKDRGFVSGRAVYAVDRAPGSSPEPRATRAVTALFCPFRALPRHSSGKER